MRAVLPILGLCLAAAIPATAQTCRLDFTVEVTQGVGDIRPGAHIPGRATWTALGRSFRQEGGSTAHLATGEMSLQNGAIRGPIWTLITTSNGAAADLIGVYAHEVRGLTVAGVAYDGPMALTLFGASGTRPEPAPPATQEEWDRMAMRRAFTLHAHGRDMLAGTVTGLTARCF